jgi:hypothetical protein
MLVTVPGSSLVQLYIKNCGLLLQLALLSVYALDKASVQIVIYILQDKRE